MLKNDSEKGSFLYIHQGCKVFFILNLCFSNVVFIIVDDFYLSNCSIVVLLIWKENYQNGIWNTRRTT